MSYLLRLVMPDRPGILGAVATALGTAGIDIVSLDVLERGTGVAVDDVVVDLPADRLPDSLITVAQSVPDVRVESLRPYAGPLDTHRELELLDALAHAGGNPPDPALAAKLLAAELPRVFHSGWAVVLDCGPGGWSVRSASEAAPSFDGVELPWMPLTGAQLLSSDDEWLPERWREMAIEMMAAPYGGDACAVVVGRSGGPAFRRSELLRLVHLIGIASTVTHLPPV
ncbi:MAG: ACT domain-containing protein [Blastococcus sp.]|nr:ACT domain-containing protein [Blastococcus sp.]